MELIDIVDENNELTGKLEERKIAHEIDNVHKSFPETLIVMTDRSKKSNPPCLQRNVLSYRKPAVQAYGKSDREPFWKNRNCAALSAFRT